MLIKRLAAAAALLALAACSKSGDHHGVHAPDYIVRGNGLEIQSLDPHYIQGQWEAFVVGDALIGLTTDGPDGEPIPGAALSWETSADGLTWTFHMRPHVWSDGQPVTAHDFVFAWQRILDPKRAAPYAYYLWLIKNARAISEGKLPPSALGIVAKDDSTLVVTLEHPAPYMLEYLLHQATFPVPRHVVLAKGNAWAKPGNYVANGPYVPTEWVANDHITLVKNPLFYDAKNVRIKTVIYKPTTDTMAALKALRAGEIDTQYLVPAQEIHWMRENIPHALQLRPTLAVAYLVLNVQRKPFQDIRMRKAIALVIDRETISGKILRLGEPAAYHLVPPGVANYPGGAHVFFENWPYDRRLAEARRLMAAMGYDADHHFHTTYDSTTTPDSRRTAATLQAMLRRIYIDVDIITSDGQVYYPKLQSNQFDIGGASWFGDFNDAGTFLDLLRTGSGNNYGRYSNPRYDALLNEADQTPDLKKRGELLAQAEQIMLDDFPISPTRFLFTQDIVEPYVKGWIPNIRDFNRSRWLWIDPKAKPERGD